MSAKTMLIPPLIYIYIYNTDHNSLNSFPLPSHFPLSLFPFYFFVVLIQQFVKFMNRFQFLSVYVVCLNRPSIYFAISLFPSVVTCVSPALALDIRRGSGLNENDPLFYIFRF